MRKLILLHPDEQDLDLVDQARTLLEDLRVRGDVDPDGSLGRSLAPRPGDVMREARTRYGWTPAEWRQLVDLVIHCASCLDHQAQLGARSRHAGNPLPLAGTIQTLKRDRDNAERVGALLYEIGRRTL